MRGVKKETLMFSPLLYQPFFFFKVEMSCYLMICLSKADYLPRITSEFSLDYASHVSVTLGLLLNLSASVKCKMGIKYDCT